jgi:lysine biosynthesis protein LysW
MKNIKCLECANDIELKRQDYKIGDIIECPLCGSELEVVEVKSNGDLALDIIEEEK